MTVMDSLNALICFNSRISDLNDQQFVFEAMKLIFDPFIKSNDPKALQIIKKICFNTIKANIGLILNCNMVTTEKYYLSTIKKLDKLVSKSKKSDKKIESAKNYMNKISSDSLSKIFQFLNHWPLKELRLVSRYFCIQSRKLRSRNQLHYV